MENKKDFVRKEWNIFNRIDENRMVFTVFGNRRGDVFEYQRYKFGFTFPEKINHFEDDNGYDLFVPIRELADGEEINDD